MPEFIDNWYENSVYNYQMINAKDFFNYHQYFSQVSDGGGVFGVFLASVSAYLHIIGGWILNSLFWFLAISYWIHNYAIFYFLSYEQRTKIRWNNLNEDQKYRIQTNIIDEIEDQDMTIELQTAKKIQIQDDENQGKNIDQINKTHQQRIRERTQEETIETMKINLQTETKEGNKTTWTKPKIDQTFVDWVKEDEENEDTNWTKSNNSSNDIDPVLPSIDLFTDLDQEKEKEKIIFNQTKAKSNVDKIYEVFKQYQVDAKINAWQVGAQVTRYEIQLKMGTKVQKILELEKELQLRLGEDKLRFEAPILGRPQAVGIEVPNFYVTLVGWKEVAKKIDQTSNKLLLGIGKDLMGEVKTIALNKQPHLLVAGSTGGGKTICLLTIICSLIYQRTPETLKLLLIDPKRVELAIFNKIPHLLTPVVTETKLVSTVLDKVINEINKRFDLFGQYEVVKIEEYNAKVQPEQRIPAIVVVIDELADLILTHQKSIEDKIVRIGQIGRAAGVFMVLATQRPSADIITSLIKTNVPGRIAFSVPSYNDSRTILNFSGAEQLRGEGDMLYVCGGEKPKRLQGTWVKREDIKNLVQFWQNKNYENYFWEEFDNLTEESENNSDVYEKVKKFVQDLEQVSISLLQRRFNLGFNRAANIFERLTSDKIIETDNGDKKPRKVIKKANN